jgi:tetratricopeptide (TPR) repeat protein
MAGSVMANAEGVNPSRHEVELQLERMLAHPLFRAKDLQGRIFIFLVRSALNRRRVTELTVFGRFYKNERFADGSNKARVNVNFLRRLLDQYYAGDGKNDPVIIALPAPERSSKRKKNYKIVKRPAGEAYRPDFSYNPRAPIAKQFAIANYLLGGSPSQVEQSLWKLDALIKAEPDHPEAVMRFIEGVAAQLLLGNVYPEDIRPHFVAGSLLWIAKLKGADAWHVHNMRGLLHLSAGDLEKAKKEFAAALKLDRQSTIARGWYTHFLLRTGKEQEAVKLVGLAAEELASNAQAQAVYGLYLLKAGQLKDAERAFAQSLALDRNCWPAHYGLTQLYLAMGNQEKAVEHAKRLETLVEPAEYQIILSRLIPPNPSGPTR